MTGMPITLEAQAERERIEAAERDRLIELQTCQCSRPICDRAYLGWWSCRRCERITSIRVRTTRGRGGSGSSGEPSHLRGATLDRRPANGARKTRVVIAPATPTPHQDAGS
jgi:hypothetical protein